MTPFLSKCIGVSLVLLTSSFVIRSIEPAYAGKNEGMEKFSDLVTTDKFAASKVLWVNIDSIDANYKAFSDLSDQAGGNLNYLMDQYKKESLDVQQRYDALQQKGAAGTISADAAQREQDDISKETDLVQKIEAEINKLQSEAMAKNDTITNGITNFLKGFAKEKKVDYVLGYGSSSNVLYANPFLDVTEEVLTALNLKYANKKKGK